MSDVGHDQPDGPFAREALHLRKLGLAPIPCGGDDGKVPAIRTRTWNGAPREETYRQLVRRFRDENIGLLTGPSRLFVVDIDQARLADDMIRRFGATPLMVQTPSGGVHLYYRAQGERCANLRQSEGLPVDLKGVGGLVIAPPSRRLTGEHEGKLYSIVQGRWEDVARLRPVKPGSLPTNRQSVPKPMPEGTRGNELFRHAMIEARSCDTFEQLLDKLRWINEESCQPPVEDARVVRTANSAWRYQQVGRNFVGNGAKRQVFNFVSEIEAFQKARGGSDACLLLQVLRTVHFDGGPFALSPRSMARDGVMAGWSERQFREARELLIDIGSLVMVHQGGRGPHDPSLFAFGTIERCDASNQPEMPSDRQIKPNDGKIPQGAGGRRV